MKTEIKVYRNDDGLWLRFISKTGQEASLNVEEMANKHGGGIISSAIKRTCGELATAYENRGIDYTKDNVYDAIGRSDLKPKQFTKEDIVDALFSEKREWNFVYDREVAEKAADAILSHCGRERR